MSTTGENKLQSTRQKLKDMLNDPENPLSGIFDKIEKTTRIPREYIAVGIVIIILIYLVIGHGTGLLVNLIGFLYPAYKSCKAIDSEETDDDTQWLTYWVVYAAFGIVEFFTDILLSWFPFYFLGKCAFLIWCMMPIANNGAAIVYNNLIKPFIKKHEKNIEKAFTMAGDIAKDVGKEALSKAKDAASNITLKDIQKVQDTVSSLHDEVSQMDEGSKKDD